MDDHIHALGICFDNVNVLQATYDYNLGGMPASELVYTYTDPLQNQLDKKGMKIISLKLHREITITYSSPIHGFLTFLPTIERMIRTLSIEE